MVQWVIGSILHGGPIELFIIPGCGMCCPVCGMVHIREHLLLIRKSNPCGGGGSGFLVSRYMNDSLAYVRFHINILKMC